MARQGTAPRQSVRRTQGRAQQSRRGIRSSSIVRSGLGVAMASAQASGVLDSSRVRRLPMFSDSSDEELAKVPAATPVELLLIDPRSLAEVIGTGTVAWKMLRTLSLVQRLGREVTGWN